MELLNDFTTSVQKAFGEIDKNWESYPGLVVCGTHSKEVDLPLLVYKIRDARENGIPFLGICAGLQFAAIEYARNVMNIHNASSEEFGGGVAIIKKLRELRVGIFKVGERLESHWHNYYLPEDSLVVANFPHIVSHGIVEEYFIPGHPHFVCVQYHPEYQSSKDEPHPILIKFINACKNYEKPMVAVVG